jgi:hypothetical protein
MQVDSSGMQFSMLQLKKKGYEMEMVVNGTPPTDLGSSPILLSIQKALYMKKPSLHC